MVTAPFIAGLGGIFASAAVSSIVAVAANLAIGALLGKILAPDLPKTTYDTKGLQNIIKSNIMPRRICYGEAIIGGPYLLLETLGSVNTTLAMIICMTTHPIEDVLGVFLDDEYINIAGVGGQTNSSSGTNDLDANYWLDTGPFGTGDAAEHVRIIKNLGWGYADNTYVTDGLLFQPALDDIARISVIRGALAGTDWTGPAPISTPRDSGTGLYEPGHKATNCSYMFLSFKYNPDVFSGFPAVKFHIKGKRLYNPNLDSDSSRLAAGADGGTHDLNDGETWEWSENWALCCLDYLIDSKYGLAAKTSGTTADPKEIDWEEAIQAVKDAGELVPNGYSSPNTGTVPRYTVNGVFETSATPISHMETLLNSGAGMLIYSQGEYKLRAGVYRAPNSSADIIDENMIVSALSIRTHTPRSQLFNKVGGIYVDKGYDDTIAISESNKPLFEPSDFPLVDPLDSGGVNIYEEIDGEEIIEELDYPFTTYEYEAQRLARIQLERIRQGLVIQFEATLEVLKYSVGDTIYLEILNDSKYANQAFFNRLGLDENVQDRPDAPFTAYYKQFKIMEMNYTENFNIEVTLAEESEEIYDWNEGDANLIDYELGSNLFIDDPNAVILPPSFDLMDSPIEAILEFTSWPNTSTLVRWNAPVNPSAAITIDRVYIGSYTLEYGAVTNPSAIGELRVDNWIKGGTVIAIAAELRQGPISLENLFIDDITNFEFRVRANAFNGRSSDWAYYSDDIGTYYTPNRPPSSDVSTPIAGQKTLKYDTQENTFNSSIGIDPGDFVLYWATSPFYTPLYEDLERIYFSPTGSDGVENMAFLNALRNGDVVTMYISTNRWYKYKLNNEATIGRPITIATSGVADNKVAYSISNLTLIDSKDTDPTNNTLLTSEVEFRFERDTENDSLVELLDGDFDRSNNIGTVSNSVYNWSFGAVYNSPDIAEFRVGEGEDESNAIFMEVNPVGGSRNEITLSSSWWFRNPSKDIRVSIKYQSTQGTDPNTSISRAIISFFGDKYPGRNLNAAGSKTAYLPSTDSGVWNTVTYVIPRSQYRYLNLSLTIQNEPAESNILDFLIDSIILEPVDMEIGAQTILASNTAVLNYNSSDFYRVDLGPATSNVTINIVYSLASSEKAIFEVETIQDTSTRTATWQFNGSTLPVIWVGGSEPALSSGSGAVDLFIFRTRDGGATWFGEANLNYS